MSVTLLNPHSALEPLMVAIRPTFLLAITALQFLMIHCDSHQNSASAVEPAELSDSTEHWPQFRGPGARGVGKNENLPEQWSATENVAWKMDIPGRGWSSPVVWGERVFLTTVVNTGTAEEPKKGLYFGGDRPQVAEETHLWKVLCLNLNDGQILWERQLYAGQPKEPIHLKSSYASETPVTDGERIYCYFGNLGLYCLDFEGEVLWKYEIEPQAMRYGWGTAASPVLHKDRVFIVNDNEDDSYLVALDTGTGREIWKTERDEKSNWATPYIWENPVRTEIVTPGTGLVRSYDLDGNLLWTLKGMSSITIATPYSYDDLLYITSGYVMDAARPIYAIRAGAAGEITLEDGQTANEWIAWSLPQAAPYNPSTLVDKDRLFVLYDRGMLAAFSATTGAEIFGMKRIPNGRAFTSSPWAYRDKIFCLNEDGVTFVFDASDTYRLLHTNELAADDMCMATPAIAGDRLLIRTTARLYCIQNSSRP